MKKIILLIFSLTCILLLASCNIQEQLEQMSDDLKSGIIDVMGPYIEKNTDTDSDKYSDEVLDNDTGSKPSDIPSDITSDIPSDIPSDTVVDSDSNDTPDEPTVPDEPVIPDYIVLEREKYPLNKYIGLDIFRVGEKFKDSEYKFRTAYGYGRYETTLNDLMGANPLTYFKISGMESSVHVDFDLSSKVEDNGNDITFSEIASKIHEFAKKYCNNSLTSNLTRIEIGTNPDTKISAKDYALLLNIIYDNNCKQNGYDVENPGTTFINPYIRLITGKMSSYNLPYIKELMNEIELARNDDFLPIGGWSFSVNTEGKSPEEVFLNNQSLKDVITYRNENYDSIEIILSDFSWDTVNSESNIYLAPNDTYTSEELQASYILRSFLILQGMGVDKASYDALNDTETQSNGIIDANGNKKLAFTMLEYFKTKMNGAFFKEVIKNGEKNVYCYKFETEDGKTILALWSTDTGYYSINSTADEKIKISTYDKENLYIDTTYQIEGGFTITLNQTVTFIEY